MAKMNTNGNAYTIIYASVMVIIVAFLLAFVASALKPTQDANVEKDKKSQILAALNIRDVEDVEGKYAEVIKKDAIYSADASKGAKAETGGFAVENKNITPDNRPLYIAEVDGETKMVVPVKGAGLWGGLWGYIAVNADGETVYGTYFSHESETAGLGARIAEQWFQDSFKGKKIFAESSDEVALSVIKKGKEGSLSPDNYVDGVTGATLTSNGVNDMIKECLSLYKDILSINK
jgi:Na+-transporting NADH:ubiquinone oxidoreductase subunit C